MKKSQKNGIRGNQYITVQGWMRNIPQIVSNNELLAYALIYGFSQTEKQYWISKQEYIAKWLGINRDSCNKLLCRMEERQLISKVLISKKGAVKQYGYYCILPQGDECSNDTRASVPTTHVTSVPTTHVNNNNIYNMRARAREKTPQNQFNNFKQNDYDFEQLEIELLSNAPERGEE